MLTTVATTIALAASAHTALPAYQWKHPVDDTKPHAVMLVIHGGGWRASGRASLAKQPTLTYRERGWATVSMDYRSGAASAADVVRIYDMVRRRFPRLPICAEGGSAGGNLALVMATLRPRLACAISAQGPVTMLPLLAGQTAPVIHAMVATDFSRHAARAYSPAFGGYSGCALLSYSFSDTLVRGASQAKAIRRMRRTWPHVTALNVRGDPHGVPWVHFAARRSDVARWADAEVTLLNRVVRGQPC